MAEENPVQVFLRRSIPSWVTGGTLSRIGIAIGVIVLFGVMFPRGEQLEFDARVGAIWAQKDLIAPFSFPILRDEREYGADVGEARRAAYPVFERDTAFARHDSLRTFFARLDTILVFMRDYRTRLRTDRAAARADSLAIAIRRAQLGVSFTEREWEILRGLSAGGRLVPMRERLAALTTELLRAGAIDRARSSLSRSELALRRGTEEEIVSSARFFDPGELSEMFDERLREVYADRPAELDIASRIGRAHLRPNIRFNATATEQAARAAAEAVPRTVGFVQENERIISQHERITPETKQKLESYRRARADRGPEADAPSQYLGTILHVGLVVTLFGIYLALFRKRISGSTRKVALIGLVMLLIGVVAWAAREIAFDAPVEYLIIVPAASMLLTIFFDSRVGFYATVILSFLVGGIWGNDYSISLASLVGGALSVYSVRDMKNRTQIFRSFLFIFIGYALTIVALGLERYEPLSLLLRQLAYALGNALISPVLTYGLLVFIEKTFRLTTDLTLLELAHFNHPLLRQLAEKAPGTYHHSMSMASLAEAAAAAIGANVVLTRVGAYFHDIGKIIKPAYFVENQKGSRNRHDRLSPRMSSLIIAAHVKEGVALAREHKLPEEVIDFIPMHHGTARMEYFYNKALELATHSEDETKIDEINDQDYRYGGPRPRTKETGIMMLADAIEAAVRTIEEPTPQRIEDLVNDVTRRRLDDGELDECPLTMEEITKIRAAFVNVLVGIYHTRVKYPGAAKRRVRKPARPPAPEPEADAEPPDTAATGEEPAP